MVKYNNMNITNESADKTISALYNLRYETQWIRSVFGSEGETDTLLILIALHLVYLEEKFQ